MFAIHFAYHSTDELSDIDPTTEVPACLHFATITEVHAALQGIEEAIEKMCDRDSTCCYEWSGEDKAAPTYAEAFPGWYEQDACTESEEVEQ